MSNSIVRIDGSIVLDSLYIHAPVLNDKTILSFRIRADGYEHGIWASGNLAMVVFCYVVTARLHVGDLSNSLETSFKGKLISSGKCSYVFGQSIQWHTSAVIRRRAETLIDDVKKGDVPKPLLERSNIKDQVPACILKVANGAQKH